MGIITPTNQEVTTFKGIHLYHARFSNCSMRVRITLAEKNLPWTSHYVDILKSEHITPEYFGINPNGVVPTLVHDGIVIIESNDIITYLDEKFPSPPLRSQDREESEEINQWLELASQIHLSVKTYIYAHAVRPMQRKNEEELASYRQLQSNQTLFDFHQRYSSSEGLSPEEVERADQTLHDCFQKIDDALQGQDWLVGDQFSLADISWIPLHFTLDIVHFPFEQYSRVLSWKNAIESRASFQEGVLNWAKD